MFRISSLSTRVLLPLSLSALFGACQALEESLQGLPGDAAEGLDDTEPRLQTQGFSTFSAQSPEESILRLAHARSTGGGYLQTLLQHDQPDVRTKAAFALGRLPLSREGDSVTRVLQAALTDDNAGVRGAAAYALGERGDASAAGALLAAWGDEQRTVRARVVQAAGRLDDEALWERCMEAMFDADEGVRRQAAQVAHGWDTEHRSAERANQALTQVAQSDASGEVRWRALFSLQRRKARAGGFAAFEQALERAAGDSPGHPLELLFACKGLARVGPELEGEARSRAAAALASLCSHPDGRVAVEALRGLPLEGIELSEELLSAAMQHPSKHVRAETLHCLARMPRGSVEMPAWRQLAQDDASFNVRAAWLTALAAQLGFGAMDELRTAVLAEAAVLRAGAAQAAGSLEAAHSIEILTSLASDANHRVAYAAISGLGQHASTSSVRKLLHELCENPDNGRKLAAVGALGEAPLQEDLPALTRAYEQASGDIGPEVRFNVLRLFGELEASVALERALADAHPYVRQVASEELTELGVEHEQVRPQSGAEAALPKPWNGSNPVVRIETDRGAMDFELYPGDAPVHVHSFLELAAAGHYDGLTWHRVVPDFVIQGGCYRGDGNGSGTWRGPNDSLTAEFNPRPYLRGSLGMPRNEDEDSGGSQIFVTHRPTPHLDGRYTLFGQLIDGAKTLDEVEVGDRILSVRRLR